MTALPALLAEPIEGGDEDEDEEVFEEEEGADGVENEDPTKSDPEAKASENGAVSGETHLHIGPELPDSHALRANNDGLPRSCHLGHLRWAE